MQQNQKDGSRQLQQRVNTVTVPSRETGRASERQDVKAANEEKCGLTRRQKQVDLNQQSALRSEAMLSPKK
ncbi:hypothetical protein EYF80_032454 [Liparis tanakae]|uniref:Uncharacterized protein n=1 Tax=Liparis tanakae TaxID=230148 RepID=A0A4Z2GV05_9TELE|nr:hypothetical protein EYF80_032454 [Liparis tanakae]